MDKEELEKLTRDYQLVQEQLQALAIQREQFSAQKEEQKTALAEVTKTTGKVYMSVGGVVVETSKDDALKDIKDRQDSTEMRLGIINKQYDEFSKREKSLRTSITEALKGEKV